MEFEILLWVYILVVLTIGLSYFYKLGVERDLFISSLRATAQLILMGFILKWVFTLEKPQWFFLILLFMTGVAAIISGNRGRAIPNAKGIAFLGIGLGSVVTFLVLYNAGIIQNEAHYIIPIGGMIIGNAMNATSLGMNRLIGELQHQRKRIEALLALGGNSRQASEEAARQAVKTALIPTIDSMKTIGLVHLPGIMTGFLIAGGSPLEAVKFQVAIVYMIAGTAGISCTTVVLLGVHQCFEGNLRLRLAHPTS